MTTRPDAVGFASVIAVGLLSHVTDGVWRQRSSASSSSRAWICSRARRCRCACLDRRSQPGGGWAGSTGRWGFGRARRGGGGRRGSFPRMRRSSGCLRRFTGPPGHLPTRHTPPSGLAPALPPRPAWVHKPKPTTPQAPRLRSAIKAPARDHVQRQVHGHGYLHVGCRRRARCARRPAARTTRRAWRLAWRLRRCTRRTS